MLIIIKWKGNRLVKAKQRILAFTSLFSFHLMIIYIIFAHTLLYVMVLQMGKICVLDLPQCEHVFVPIYQLFVGFMLICLFIIFILL